MAILVFPKYTKHIVLLHSLHLSGNYWSFNFKLEGYKGGQNSAYASAWDIPSRPQDRTWPIISSWKTKILREQQMQSAK